MRATEITTDNFDDTIEETLNQRDIGSLTYYLDKHIFEGGEFFTVSQDENILGCWDDFQSAVHLFHNQN